MTATQIADLVATHAAALTLFARQWCAQPEDAVQDVFCKLVQQRTAPPDAVAWLFRVVRTSAIDRGRSDRRRAQRESASAKPEAWFAQREIEGLDAEAAVAALQSLTDEQREVIVARLWGGMTLEQIATIADCSLTTAHRRYETGIATLRERLGVTCPK